MKRPDNDKTKVNVKKAYGEIATGQRKGCGCGCTCGPDADKFAGAIGYSDDDLKAVPAGSNLTLSCGNPTAIAGLTEGETVLDLGSGAGFDCFIAASKVGAHGKVIGIDMTPEMVEKAKDNAKKNGSVNVEFRLGDIEDLPVDSDSIDVILSNCVINLSSDKQKTFQEAYRVLKNGGRLAISDMALLKELPDNIKKSIDAYVGCVGGAVLVDTYKELVASAGFRDIKVTVKGSSSCIDPDTKDPIGRAILDALGKDRDLSDYVVSISVEALK